MADRKASNIQESIWAFGQNRSEKSKRITTGSTRPATPAREPER